MLTEQQNPNSADIDRRSTLEMLQIINAADSGVANAISPLLPSIAEAVDAIVARFKHDGRLIYVGAGTSGRLGVLDAAECVPTFGTPPEMVQGLIAGGEKALVHAVEGAEDDRDAGRRDLLALKLTAHDIVVGIAASGRTPYVLGALEYANQIGAATVAMTCNSPSPMLDVAAIAIPVLVGPEVITGSTRLKAGTAQKMVLNMLSTASMIKMGKVYGNLMVDVKVTNQKLSQRACRIVSQVTGLSADEAQALLTRTGNAVKPAIVVGLLGVTPQQAMEMLDNAEGHLSAILPDPQ